MDKVKKFIVNGQEIEVAGGGGGGGVSVTEITWKELKDLKDNKELVPGSIYRITDYTATTDEVGSISAGHRFDIIVTALSATELSEDASACRHVFTDAEKQLYSEAELHYFDNSNLGAWELKYSLENDEDRFGWACNSALSETIEIPETITISIRDPQTCLDLNDHLEDGPVLDVECTYMYINNGEIWYRVQNEYVNAILCFQKYRISTDSMYGTDFRIIKDIFNLPGTSDEAHNKYRLQAGLRGIVSTSGAVDIVLPSLGKGVVYYMKDEWENECGYDFKNIQFLKDGQYMYTFSMLNPENYVNVGILKETDYKKYSGGVTYGVYNASEGDSDAFERTTPATGGIYLELISTSSTEMPGFPYKFIQRDWGHYKEFIMYFSDLGSTNDTFPLHYTENGKCQVCSEWTNGHLGLFYTELGSGSPDHNIVGLFTFNIQNELDIIRDASLSDLCLVHHNVIKDNYIYNNDTYEIECSNILRTDVNSEIRHLPYNIFVGTANHNNILGINNRANYFEGLCNNNVLGNNCYYNKFYGANEGNNLGFACMLNLFCTGASTNILDSYCINNTLGYCASANKLGYGNTFVHVGVHSTNNTFGDRCLNIHLGPWKAFFTFDGGNYDIYFGGSYGGSYGSGTTGTPTISGIVPPDASPVEWFNTEYPNLGVSHSFFTAFFRLRGGCGNKSYSLSSGSPSINNAIVPWGDGWYKYTSTSSYS